MYIKVRVKTKASKEALVQKSPTHFDIAVREEPLQNLANRRVIELVAAHCKVPVKAVRIISGHRSPSKILSVPEKA